MKAYPIDTGGGCQALRIDLFSGLYLLVTDDSGGRLPTVGSRAWVSINVKGQDDQCPECFGSVTVEKWEPDER